MGQPGRIIGTDGVDYGFSAPGKWCRHKTQFLTWEAITDGMQVTCSNCAQATRAVAPGFPEEVLRQYALDALMKIEAEGAVTEVSAP